MSRIFKKNGVLFGKEITFCLIRVQSECFFSSKLIPNVDLLRHIYKEILHIFIFEKYLFTQVMHVAMETLQFAEWWKALQVIRVPHTVCHNCSTLQWSTEATMGNVWISEPGCVPIELYLWALKFEFHIIFACHKILFFWFFFQPYKNVKSILSLGTYKTDSRLDVALELPLAFPIPHLLLPLPIPRLLGLWELVLSSKSGHVGPPTLWFFKIVLAIPVPLPYRINFRITLLISTKNSPQILVGIILNLQNNLGRIDMLPVTVLRELRVSLHLFTSLISF